MVLERTSLTRRQYYKLLNWLHVVILDINILTFLQPGLTGGLVTIARNSPNILPTPSLLTPVTGRRGCPTEYKP